MIEKYTEEELKIIIKELRAVGYDVKQTTKQMVMKEEAGKIFGGDPFVCADIGGSIFKIADFMLDNYDRKPDRKTARKKVQGDIEEEYRRIVSEILGVIRKYYGMNGFRDRNDPVRRVNG